MVCILFKPTQSLRHIKKKNVTGDSNNAGAKMTLIDLKSIISENVEFIISLLQIKYLKDCKDD